jgi:hypothetical protein
MMTSKQKPQIQKFRDAARATEAHDSEERFNESLKALARKPRQGHPPERKSKAKAVSNR